MLRGSDRSDALRELVDEIIALVLVTANQFVDALARVAILQLVEMRQRHRMNLNAIGDDELDARQADAVARQFPPTKRAARAGDIEHDRRARFWQLLQADFLLGEIEQSVVNKAFVALSAGERHLLAIAQNFCRLSRADDCRNAELAADDRRMTSSPAEVGDDAFGFFQDRTPIGIGHFSDENRAFLESPELARALDAADFRGSNGFADGQTGEQPFAFLPQPISGQRTGFLQRLYRLGPRLHDEKLTAIASSRPFDVHRLFVMLLDRARPFGQTQDFIVVEHE